MWLSGMHGIYGNQGASIPTVNHLVTQLCTASIFLASHYASCSLYMHERTTLLPLHPKPLTHYQEAQKTAQQIIKAMKVAPAQTRVLQTYTMRFNISTGVYSGH